MIIYLRIIYLMNITFEYSFRFYLYDEYYFQIFTWDLLFNEYYLWIFIRGLMNILY